ncbi:MAG: (Fe-S)-binding protein [Bacteroidetes bacterium]|nr:(Fe-S)-binding protein [Bacteroidota bacterium]
MRSDLFILPFNLGLWFILLYCIARCVVWFRDLSRTDKLRLQRGFFGKAFGQSLREIFMESLLHRKIFRVNPVLGYMHMSLAFGWFLLILFGTIEADLLGDRHLNPPHKAIFFRFYNPGPAGSGLKLFFSFLMDFILAFILSGLLIAVVKRFIPKAVGMKKTTTHTVTDRLALASLWLIFPARLMAESFTSATDGGGSFLTGNLGQMLATAFPSQNLAMPFWWLYSLALGTFFILLPRTRYLHIPVELFLIFMRNSGITTGDRHGSYADVEIHSCSSCGVCLNSCQMAINAGVTNIQPVYLNKSLRENGEANGVAFNCLMCGRCEEVCPVGIETTAVRMIQRREEPAARDMTGIWKGFIRTRQAAARAHAEPETKQAYRFLKAAEAGKADVAFFAGCMTHLTPGVIRSMETLFGEAGIKYTFIDRESGVCCGRPLMLAGKEKEARELINHNSRLIWASGAKTVVTPCPICYKVFSESYYLEAEVMHHSQFINRLIEREKLNLRFTGEPVVWHDPCELGRGSGVYDEPRQVLSHVTRLKTVPGQEEMGLCCGGSLGNLSLPAAARRKISAAAAASLASSGAATLVTGCPMCKKTFNPVSEIPVKDIAEVVTAAIYDRKAGVEVVKTDTVECNSYGS